MPNSSKKPIPNGKRSSQYIDPQFSSSFLAPGDRAGRNVGMKTILIVGAYSAIAEETAKRYTPPKGEPHWCCGDAAVVIGLRVCNKICQVLGAAEVVMF